ncbi:MAG: response regulator, partial [Reichenbachiella sp.]
YVTVEECESADEAEELLEEIDANGDYAALVISDHVMPGKTGVQFLTTLFEDDRFKETKKILLTGQATHVDTIQAINMADIDFYMEKPWDKEDLISKVKTLLTTFIIKKGMDYNEFTPILDKQKLFNLLK